MIAKLCQWVLFGAAFAAAGIGSARAQTSDAPAGAGDAMHARLSADRVGDIKPGEYSAGEDLDFILAADGDRFLLRFTGSPETFVLHVDRASLGGRVLKYDYGATGMQVSSWGGVTIYTATAPGGLPAIRVGDASAPVPVPVSESDLRGALRDEARHLLYLRQLQIVFSAALRAPDTEARMLAFTALTNAGIGLDRLSENPAARRELKKIAMVEIADGKGSAIQRTGRILRVRFDPADGYEGLASSETIARAVGKLLSVPYGD